jgi:hypothetical protein
VFLGYSNKHKGFKWLDLFMGRTYISWDVIFDENVFPFSKLSPNAGPRLRAEISLLPPSLYGAGGGLVLDHMTNVSNTADNFEKMQHVQDQTEDTREPMECTSPEEDILKTGPVPGAEQRALDRSHAAALELDAWP